MRSLEYCYADVRRRRKYFQCVVKDLFIVSHATRSHGRVFLEVVKIVVHISTTHKF